VTCLSCSCLSACTTVISRTYPPAGPCIFKFLRKHTPSPPLQPRPHHPTHPTTTSPTPPTTTPPSHLHRHTPECRPRFARLHVMQQHHLSGSTQLPHTQALQLPHHRLLPGQQPAGRGVAQLTHSLQTRRQQAAHNTQSAQGRCVSRAAASSTNQKRAHVSADNALRL
jgi:hypothetical protein